MAAAAGPLRGARRGVFGKLPTAAPSLAATLVSIAKQMQASEDSNITSAWQAGGTWTNPDTGVNGPVTDSMLLAWWRKRLAGVAKNDPLYDTYNQDIQQLDYTIAESKMTAAYKTGKVSEPAMAQFYLDWAKKIPVNSEFYRVLQRDAGQYMQIVRQTATAAAKAAAATAYANAQTNTYNGQIKAADFLLGVLNDMASANGLIGTNGPLNDLGTTGSDITNFNPSDPGRMMDLIAQLNGQKQGTGANATAYIDPSTQQPVTLDSILSTLQRLDPGFNGSTLSMSYMQQILHRATIGVQAQLALAVKTGHTADVNTYTKDAANLTEFARETRAWPVEQTYMADRTTWLQTWNDPSSSPSAKLAAWTTYKAKLGALAATPGLDSNTSNRLLSEANLEAGIPSLAESFTGAVNTNNTDVATGGFKGDIAGTAAGVAQFQQMVDGVNGGQMLWTTGSYDKTTGVFVPKPGGESIGAAPITEVQSVSAAGNATMLLPVPGGQPIPVYVPAFSVTTAATGPVGGTVPSTDTAPLAQAYKMTIGGSVVTMYQFQGQNGQSYYTMQAPWSASLPVSVSGDKMVVNVTSLVPYRDSNGTLIDPSTGQPVPTSAAAPGGVGFYLQPPATGTAAPTLRMDPNQSLFGSDPSHAYSGPNPAIDFFSPILALASALPDGKTMLSQNPTLLNQLLQQSQMSVTGQPLDAATAQQNSDQVWTAIGMGQLDRGRDNPTSPLGFQRTNVAATFAGMTPAQIQGLASTPSVGMALDQNMQRADGAVQPVSSPPSSSFGVLSTLYRGGTNILRGADAGGAVTTPAIQTPTQLKVPGYGGLGGSGTTPIQPIPQPQTVAVSPGPTPGIGANIGAGPEMPPTTSAPAPGQGSPGPRSV